MPVFNISRGWIIYFCFIGLAITFVYVCVMYSFGAAVQNVLIAAIVSLLATIIGIALGLKRLEHFIEHSNRRSVFGVLADFWIPKSNEKHFTIIFGAKGHKTTEDPEPRLTYPTALAYTEIVRLLKDLMGDQCTTEMRRFDEISDWPRVLSCNVVFLGGNISMPPTEAIISSLKVPLRQGADGRSIELLDGSEWRLYCSSQLENGVVVEDYALITKISVEESGTNIFLISGGYGAGTLGGALALTNPAYYNSTPVANEASVVQSVVRAAPFLDNGASTLFRSISFDPWREVHIGVPLTVSRILEIGGLREVPRLDK